MVRRVFLGHPNLEVAHFVVFDYSMLVLVLAVAVVGPILDSAVASSFLPDYHRYHLTSALFRRH